MSLPPLTEEQYIDLDGPEADVFWLQVVEVEQLFRPDWDQPSKRGLRVEFLNVTEPHEYRTPTGYLVIILPIGDPLTYDMIDAFWPSMTSPFAYIVRGNLYDDLEDTDIYFKYGKDQDDGNQPLPPFHLSDWRTH